MEISGTNMLQYLSNIYGTIFDSNSSSLLEVQGNQSGSTSESLDISAFGKLRNAVSRMSDEDKEKMRAFHEQMMESVKNGTFDASQMAADAPESLKSFAEENGIDLEEMLGKDASRMQRRANGAGAPPPPPMMSGEFGAALSKMSDDEKEQMKTFMDKMMEAVQNGTFDASQMAADAPEALKSFAEENGVDLESMLQDQAANMKNFAEGQKSAPFASPTMYGSDGSAKTCSSQELTMDFLRQLLQGEKGEETRLASVGNL